MSQPPILSRAGAKPGSLGLSGSAGLQKKPMTLGAKKVGMSLGAAKKKPGATASAFAGALDDDLDDDASARARVAQELRHSGGGGSSIANAAAFAAKQAALEEDAGAFDYDGVYDEMQEKKQSAVRLGVQKAEEKTAKYIGGIMQAHKVREIENEKVFERKLQKEAEAEAHLYGDKEKFMTSAYRKKLEARDEYEAELKRQEAEEAKEDVTKRGGLGHFYANLLDNNMTGNGLDKAAAAAGRSGGDGDVGQGSSGGGEPAVEEEEAKEEEEEEEAPAPAAAASSSSGGLVEASLADSISAAVGALGSVPKEAATAATAPAPAPTITHERRNDSDAVMSARERYLARKRAREENGGG